MPPVKFRFEFRRVNRVEQQGFFGCQIVERIPGEVVNFGAEVGLCGDKLLGHALPGQGRPRKALSIGEAQGVFQQRGLLSVGNGFKSVFAKRVENRNTGFQQQGRPPVRIAARDAGQGINDCRHTRFDESACGGRIEIGMRNQGDVAGT